MTRVQKQQVNTITVRALMALRQVDEEVISHVLQIPVTRLRNWLYGEGGDDEPSVPYERQLEILEMLQVDLEQEAPRSDVVHHWAINEPLTGSTSQVYWALEVMTRSFGRAQAVFVAPESDPSFSFEAVARYGLRFDTFYAMLTVRAPAIRTLRFDPQHIPGISWMPGNFGVLLEHQRLPQLEPGEMTVEQFSQDVNIPQELLKWERLSQIAARRQIKPEEVVRLLAQSQTHSQDVRDVVEELAPESEGSTVEEADALFRDAEEVPPSVNEETPVSTGELDSTGDEVPVGPTGAPPRRIGHAFNRAGRRPVAVKRA